MDFLEEVSGKNLHLEHIEDEILNFGISGGRSAINFLRSLRDMLAGSASSSVDVTVKWDGAPAIFCGTDPEDGRFFVGTKGVFSKSPKVVKDLTDIEKLGYGGGLAEKLRVALTELPRLGIEGVLQGDMMYTRSDIEDATIDGVNYITFQPNTIVYAVPKGSELAEKILSSAMGIVFHTTYKGGPTLSDMSAEFGVNLSGMNDSKMVWYVSAEYPDKSGKITNTASETKKLRDVLTLAGKEFHTIDSRVFNEVMAMEESYPSSAVGSKLKTFNNSKIRQGEEIVRNKAVKHIAEYLQFFDTFWETKLIAKIKTEKTQQIKREQKDKYIEILKKSSKTLAALIKFQIHLVNAKKLILKKLNTGAKMDTKTFVRTDNGYKVVNPEGFVAIDKTGGAVKLVDRLEFSYNNFNAVKNWDK